MVLLIVSFFIRLWWIGHIPSEPIFDFNAYYEIACNLYNNQGHVYLGEPVAFQGMAYPYMLAGFFKLFGRCDLYFAKLVNIPFSMGTLVLCYFIFKKILVKENLVLIACTLVAFLPNYVAYNNVIGNEVFFTFLFALLVFLQITAFHGLSRCLLIGLVIGLAALTKPYFLVFPFVAAFTEWLLKKDLRASGLLLGVSFGVMVIVVAPWTVRNYKAYHTFIPISYNSGYVFYVNNNPNNTTGLWMPLEDALEGSEVREEALAILAQKDVKLAYELDPLLNRAGRKWALAHPAAYFELGFLRLKEIFFSGAWDIDSWAMNGLTVVKDSSVRHKNAAAGIFHVIVYILSSFGLGYTLLNVPRLLRQIINEKALSCDCAAVVDIGFFVAVYFFFEGQARYNFPLLFLFAVLFVLCCDRIYTSLSV